MPSARKILGQVAPVPNTWTTLYTVPDSTQAQVGTLHVCNQDSLDTTFDVRVAKAGAAESQKQYLYSQEPSRKHRAFPITTGWTLAAKDVVLVRTPSALMSFDLFGMEIT